MLKISASNNDAEILGQIESLTEHAIRSKLFYPGFSDWFSNTFKPGLERGDRSIISLRDKRYGTLLGFSLLKNGEENKICNLSPLVDGVGITQALLDVSLFYFSKDFIIDVPINPETVRLHEKLKALNFDRLSQSMSSDNTKQITYIFPRNISWL